MGTNIKDYVITEENKEEILNLLRDQNFISHISCRELEKIINGLDFKSLFNIIQNKSILDKISIIQTNILEKDRVFFPNFLDSPTIINKTSQIMIYDMLNYLDNDKIINYLICPYIREKLTDNEVIELLCSKEVPFNKLVENDYLFNSISNNLLTNYINKLWLKEPNSKILTKKVIKRIFDINDEALKEINLEEINYLFETIKMKSSLSIQETKVRLSSYKALLSSYLVLGTKKTLDLINNGNKDMKANTINVLLKEIVDYELKDFFSQNYDFLQNVEKNIVDNLKLIDSNNKSNFTKKVLKNNYLKSLINLLLANKYSSLNNIIDILYNVNKHKNNVNTKRILSNFCNDFVNYIVSKKKKDSINSMQNTFLKHFELKKNVREKEYRKLKTLSLQKIKLKLFIEALKGNVYSYAFKNGNPTHFLNTYLKFIKKCGFEEKYFINHILNPLSKSKFEVISFLQKLGITKPYNYDLYEKMEKDKKIIFEINTFIKEIRRKYNKDTIVHIINYICYGTIIKGKISKKDLEKINSLHLRALDISKEIYINKIKWEVELQNYYDIFDDYELINYISDQEKIDKIIKKTLNYLNYHMNSKEIKQKHFKEFLKLTSVLSIKLPFTDINYSLIVRPFTFVDLERIFDGFDLQKHFIQDKDLESFLIDKKFIIFVAEGYLDDKIKFGSIISRWQDIKYTCQILNLDINKLTIFDYYKIIQDNTFK